MRSRPAPRTRTGVSAADSGTFRKRSFQGVSGESRNPTAKRPQRSPRRPRARGRTDRKRGERRSLSSRPVRCPDAGSLSVFMAAFPLFPSAAARASPRRNSEPDRIGPSCTRSPRRASSTLGIGGIRGSRSWHSRPRIPLRARRRPLFGGAPAGRLRLLLRRRDRGLSLHARTSALAPGRHRASPASSPWRSNDRAGGWWPEKAVNPAEEPDLDRDGPRKFRNDSTIGSVDSERVRRTIPGE